MTKDLIAAGVTVKVLGTCQARCGIRKGDPNYEGTQKAMISSAQEEMRYIHHTNSPYNGWEPLGLPPVPKYQV